MQAGCCDETRQSSPGQSVPRAHSRVQCLPEGCRVQRKRHLQQKCGLTLHGCDYTDCPGKPEAPAECRQRALPNPRRPAAESSDGDRAPGRGPVRRPASLSRLAVGPPVGDTLAQPLGWPEDRDAPSRNFDALPRAGIAGNPRRPMTRAERAEAAQSNGFAALDGSGDSPQHRVDHHAGLRIGEVDSRPQLPDQSAPRGIAPYRVPVVTGGSHGCSRCSSAVPPGGCARSCRRSQSASASRAARSSGLAAASKSGKAPRCREPALRMRRN